MEFKIKATLFALLFLFVSVPLSATTVLVIITPDGIVVAADSKTITKYFGGESGPEFGPTKKIFLIHNRIAVGTVGMAGAPQVILTAANRPIFTYDPIAWFAEIENKTPEDVSVREVVRIIKSKSDSAFSPVGALIDKGAIKQKQAGNYRLQYIVCGFDDAGVAVVEEVNLNFDWQNGQLIGPDVVPVFPDFKARRFDFGFHAASSGYTDAVDAVLREQANSKMFKSVVAEAGKELSIFLTKKDLNLDQASRLLCAILRAQHKHTPSAVGPPYDVIWLQKDGMVNRVNYFK